MPSDNVRPYRQCGYCHTWNTRPCGEQCAWSPGDPPFSEQQPLVDGELFAVVHLNTVVMKLAKGEATTEDYAQARERLIAALRAPQETGWRPISTAKPKIHERVLLWWTTRGACSGYFDVDGDRNTSGWRGDQDLVIPRDQEKCTHWQPLPPAPRPEEAE